MNNNLDHLFKKALQDKSCEPPPYIWGNIERQLNKNKHKVALWWWRTAAAAAVVAAPRICRLPSPILYKKKRPLNM